MFSMVTLLFIPIWIIITPQQKVIDNRLKVVDSKTMLICWRGSLIHVFQEFSEDP